MTIVREFRSFATITRFIVKYYKLPRFFYITLFPQESRRFFANVLT